LPLLTGQESSGIRLSNFGGINAVHLNPSNLVNSKLFLDFNLLSGNLHVENNFLFIHKEDYRFGNFIKKNPVFPSTNIPGQGLDYNADRQLINGFMQTDFYGPAFSIVKANHAAGIFTRAVTMTSVKDLPGYLGILMFEGLGYDTLHGIPQNNDPFDAAVAGWWEWGVSYAYRFSQNRKSNWSLGINIRRLYGYAGMSLYTRNANYTVINDELIEIRNLDATILLDAPVDYNNNDFPTEGALFKGRGTIFDIGATYIKNREIPDNRLYKRPCAEEFQEYHYKIGVSLLGLGNLRFSENTIQQHYNNVSVDWQQIDTIEYVNINTLTQQLSEVFYGNPISANINSNSFEINMPTTLSFQGDLNYYPGWHISGMAMFPIRTSTSQIRKPGLALVSLRYETPAFEFSLPVSLYNFDRPRIGLSARVYFFTIGTDKLGGFFGYKDFYGMDLYFAAKFHILKGQCNRYKPAKDCRNYRFN